MYKFISTCPICGHVQEIEVKDTAGESTGGLVNAKDFAFTKKIHDNIYEYETNIYCENCRLTFKSSGQIDIKNINKVKEMNT